MKGIIQEKRKKNKEALIRGIRSVVKVVSSLSKNQQLVLNAIVCHSLRFSSNDVIYNQISKHIKDNFYVELSEDQVRYAVNQLDEKISWLTVVHFWQDDKRRKRYVIKKEILEILQTLKENKLYIRLKEGCFVEKASRMIAVLEKSRRSYDIVTSGIWYNLVPLVGEMINKTTIFVKDGLDVRKILQSLNSQIAENFSSRMHESVFNIVARFSGLFYYIGFRRRQQEKIILHMADRGKYSSQTLLSKTLKGFTDKLQRSAPPPAIELGVA